MGWSSQLMSILFSIWAFKPPKQSVRNWFETTPMQIYIYIVFRFVETTLQKPLENQEKPLHEGCLGGAERSSAVTLRRCEPGQPRVLPKWSQQEARFRGTGMARFARHFFFGLMWDEQPWCPTFFRPIAGKTNFNPGNCWALKPVSESAPSHHPSLWLAPW